MIGILVVFFEDLGNIPRLAASLLSQDYKDFRVYCIDNNPCFQHIDAFRKVFCDFDFLPSQGNIGFAKGNNLLAQQAIEEGCEYLFVLNPDMELASNSLSIFKKICDQNTAIGICSSVLLFGQEKRNSEQIQLFGGKANFKKQVKDFLFCNQYLISADLPDSLIVDFVNGGSTFIRKEVVTRCGLFEESYFMYNDEIDLAFRVFKAGFKTVVTSKTKIWHHHDWSLKRSNQAMYYYMMRNRYLYFKKHQLYFNLLYDLVLQVATIPIKIKWFCGSLSKSVLKYYYLGILYGILGEKGKSRFRFYE